MDAGGSRIRAADDRRNDAFKAAAIDGEFGFEDGMLVIQNGAAPGCDSAERARCLSCRDFADTAETFAHPLHPERAIGIQ